MIHPNYLHSFVVLGLLWTGFVPARADCVKIVPTTANLSYINNVERSSPEILIETPEKTEAYTVTIEPEFDIGHNLVGLILAVQASQSMRQISFTKMRIGMATSRSSFLHLISQTGPKNRSMASTE